MKYSMRLVIIITYYFRKANKYTIIMSHHDIKRKTKKQIATERYKDKKRSKRDKKKKRN